jgi:cytochrome c553
MILMSTVGHQLCARCKTKLIKYKRVKGLCLRCYNRQYQRKKKHHIKSLPWMHRKRFGGLRERVIQRDDEQCTICGMTRQEHYQKWAKDITVDHMDGNGRYSPKKNHDIDNMRTLCLSCHGREDQKRAPLWQSLPQETRNKMLSNLKHVKRK